MMDAVALLIQQQSRSGYEQRKALRPALPGVMAVVVAWGCGPAVPKGGGGALVLLLLPHLRALGEPGGVAALRPSLQEERCGKG